MRASRPCPASWPRAPTARQVRLGNDNLCALAASFAEAGFTPVIDWIIPDRAQLDQLLEALRPPESCWCFDTSDQTPDWTASKIAASASILALVDP